MSASYRAISIVEPFRVGLRFTEYSPLIRALLREMNVRPELHYARLCEEMGSNPTVNLVSLGFLGHNGDASTLRLDTGPGRECPMLASRSRPNTAKRYDTDTTTPIVWVVLSNRYRLPQGSFVIFSKRISVRDFSKPHCSHLKPLTSCPTSC